jgi:hypothetical protein
LADITGFGGDLRAVDGNGADEFRVADDPLSDRPDSGVASLGYYVNYRLDLLETVYRRLVFLPVWGIYHPGDTSLGLGLESAVPSQAVLRLCSDSIRDNENVHIKELSMPGAKVNILVVFYSRDGSVESLAKAVSEGGRKAGAVFNQVT